MKLISNTYLTFKVNLLMRLMAFVMVVFIAKPLVNAVNSYLENSDEISFLLEDSESLDDENSEEEVEEMDKILHTFLVVNLKRESNSYLSSNNFLDSDYEFQLIDPPPEFIL